jgi:hypothetical protein
MEKPPEVPGLSYVLYQYSGWSITHTPRECAGLAWVFVSLGLDKISVGERRGDVAAELVRPLCSLSPKQKVLQCGGLSLVYFAVGWA